MFKGMVWSEQIRIHQICLNSSSDWSLNLAIQSETSFLCLSYLCFFSFGSNLITYLLEHKLSPSLQGVDCTVPKYRPPKAWVCTEVEWSEARLHWHSEWRQTAAAFEGHHSIEMMWFPWRYEGNGPRLQEADLNYCRRNKNKLEVFTQKKFWPESYITLYGNRLEKLCK